MDRTSIRAWRRIQKKRMWRNRLRIIFRAFSTAYLEDSATGEKREAKTWTELRKSKMVSSISYHRDAMQLHNV